MHKQEKYKNILIDFHFRKCQHPNPNPGQIVQEGGAKEGWGEERMEKSYKVF